MAKIILLSGPSGVGKGTIEKELFNDETLNLAFSISATTRAKRNNEIDGKHYYFIDKETFLKWINENKFLEYNQHFDNYYGTLTQEVISLLNKNKNVLVEIETKGALKLVKKLKELKMDHLLISIFIVPPSLEELEKRIKNRNTESDEEIKKRIKRAEIELNDKKYFQHVVKNDNIKEAINKISEIIKSES